MYTALNYLLDTKTLYKTFKTFLVTLSIQQLLNKTRSIEEVLNYTNQTILEK